MLYTQMGKNHTYSNFKKRLVDILEARGFGNLKPEQIRMWLSSGSKELEKSFKDIKDGKKSETKETGKLFLKSSKLLSDMFYGLQLEMLKQTQEQNSLESLSNHMLEPR